MKPAKKAPAKKTVATKVTKIKNAAQGVAGGLMSNELIKGLLINALYDLLKNGWHVAAPALANLINQLSVLQFASFAYPPTQPEAEVIEADYDKWLSSLLAVIAQLRRRIVAIEHARVEYEATLEQIAFFLAEELMQAARTGDIIEIEHLMNGMRAYLFYLQLERTVPPKPASKVRRRAI
ncbi:hypothetical protein [Duganella aquatilis]|uniref:hypothetical protein n=1 Tax=Duganella aquatilis TaxID=2666082 RepID=UPI0012B0F145|nr:hypothetical protein [Duganella aquatilis]